MAASPPAFDPPDTSASEEAAMPYVDTADDVPGSEIEAVRRRHEQEIVSIDGVMGIAVGRTATGEDALVLYLRDPSVRDRVPTEIEGHPVETIVTGIIDAYGATED